MVSILSMYAIWTYLILANLPSYFILGKQLQDGVTSSLVIRKCEKPQGYCEYDYDLFSHTIITIDWDHFPADAFFPGYYKQPEEFIPIRPASVIINGLGSYQVLWVSRSQIVYGLSENASKFSPTYPPIVSYSPYQRIVYYVYWYPWRYIHISVSNIYSPNLSHLWASKDYIVESMELPLGTTSCSLCHNLY